MYVGSVRFFKHLIIFVIVILIAVPTALAVVFGLENCRKDEEIEALSSDKEVLSTLVNYYNGETDYTAAEIYDVINSANVDYADLVELLYDKQPQAFEELLDRIERGAVITSSDDSSIYANPVINSDSQTMEDENDEIPSITEAPPVTEPDLTDLTTASSITESEPASSYEDLYPELYVDLPPVTAYNQDDNYIYLTFDDGPSDYTENLLYYLNQHNIKATFFVVPKDTDASFRLMKRIVEEGHTIGVHSASHVYNDIYAGVEAFLDDFQKAYDLIYQATGVKCELYRFPGGSINDYNVSTRSDIIAEMSRRGFVFFDWNVDSCDALGASWTQMYNTVLEEVSNNNRSVILMHDGYENTVLVLEDIIKALEVSPEGYTFGQLSRNVRPMQF